MLEEKDALKAEREQQRLLEENKKPEELILLYWKFNPFDEKYLKILTNPAFDYKIRVYILTCQNLSAVDNYVDLKSRLAGDKALSSADPYPVLMIGNGENDLKTKKVKRLDDRDKNMSATLNPQFYRSYELDASFPDDWKL